MRLYAKYLTKQATLPGRLLLGSLACAGFLLASGCATTGAPRPQPLKPGEITGLVKSGSTPEQVMAAVKERGVTTPNSEDIENLRKSGATHEQIDQLLQVNQPTQWMYVSPPAFSLYFGRAGWYWVDSFGWPVYPQPYWGPYSHPRYYRPIPKEVPVSPPRSGPSKSEPAPGKK
jgi:hypothetical protein